MQTVSASEVKHRGVAALESCLVNGPVHIVKNNRLLFVVLSESDYVRLCSIEPSKLQSGLDFMLHKPATGNKTRSALDKLIKLEKENWEKQ